MSIKIGIPRALLYYEYYPLWKTFFEELDAEIVLSDTTTKDILNKGVESCINDACLPVKLFHGHVINLKDRVDYLFIPRLISVYRKEYVCPKFSGLPEMIRFSITDLPPVIDTKVYLRKSRRQLGKAFLDAGGYLTKDKTRIKAAGKKAISEHYLYMKKIEDGRLPSEILENQKINQKEECKLNIAVMGHVYNLYDRYVNMNLFKKLSSQNIRVLTPEMVDKNVINTHAATLEKKMFWTFGRRQMGTALYLLDSGQTDGIIYIMSFGCGIDSFVADLIEKRVKRESDIPFFLMMIDEQSGETGVNTRLEAFIDMINWRKKDADIPAYR